MVKKIGLETSSIMPLLETTTRTLPLQEQIKAIISKKKIEFFTDMYSVVEATQQINRSFENAKKSIIKAKNIAHLRNFRDVKTLTVVFIKALSENWYGREETLRWSDIVIKEEIQNANSTEDFFDSLNRQLEKKKQVYSSMLKINDGFLNIDCTKIQSYWITPSFSEDLKLQIRVVDNEITLEAFFSILQSAINSAYMGKFKINNVVDVYHLYSLYKDTGVREVWSCNQQFAKVHKEYLKTTDDFKDLFDTSIVKIKRIE